VNKNNRRFNKCNQRQHKEYVSNRVTWSDVAGFIRLLKSLRFLLFKQSERQVLDKNKLIRMDSILMMFYLCMSPSEMRFPS